MHPRASWKGQLRVSLVAFPIRLYNAISSTTRISLNQLHKACHRRLRQKMVCPEHGDIERDEIIKGYEYEKDKYVIIDEADLEKIQIETTKTIDIVQFMSASELDPMYLESPYYVAPDNPVAEEAFRVVREAMRKNNVVGVGRVVMTSAEQTVALQVKDRGFLMTTLRSPDEVRHATPYFEEIRNGDVDKGQLKLAEQLVESLMAPFEPAQFTDHYREALLALLKAKIEGTEPVISPSVETGQVINLMEALKKSVAATGQKKPPAKSVKPAAEKTQKRKRA